MADISTATRGWVNGAANAVRYPTDHMGAGTATAGSSLLHNINYIDILGILVIVPETGAIVSVVDAAGTTIGGLDFTLAAGHIAGTFIPFGAGSTYYSATNANVGIKFSNNSTVRAALFYARGG